MNRAGFAIGCREVDEEGWRGNPSAAESGQFGTLTATGSATIAHPVSGLPTSDTERAYSIAASLFRVTSSKKLRWRSGQVETM